MKIFDPTDILSEMFEDRSVSTLPMPGADSIVFNKAILTGLVHISKQIAELRQEATGSKEEEI